MSHIIPDYGQADDSFGGSSGLPYGGQGYVITVPMTGGTEYSFTHGYNLQDIAFNVQDTVNNEIQGTLSIYVDPADPLNAFKITMPYDCIANQIRVIIIGHQ